MAPKKPYTPDASILGGSGFDFFFYIFHTPKEGSPLWVIFRPTSSIRLYLHKNPIKGFLPNLLLFNWFDVERLKHLSVAEVSWLQLTWKRETILIDT